MGGFSAEGGADRGAGQELFVGLGPALSRVLRRLPAVTGTPVVVEWRLGLRTSRGRLEAGPGPGRAVHAASYPRLHRLVLDASLRRQPGERERIFIHELFHFIWPRLGNGERQSWGNLLSGEWQAGVPGELGWSAESRKLALTPQDWHGRTRRWREYACESFCDSAAWRFSGLSGHDEFTLPAAARRQRSHWLDRLLRHHPDGFRI